MNLNPKSFKTCDECGARYVSVCLSCAAAEARSHSPCSGCGQQFVDCVCDLGDDDTGYSPEDRETLRRDWERRFYGDEFGSDPGDLPDWSPAPPDSYIALSDAEIDAAEREDRDFQSCHECGQFHEDCQCDE